MKSYHLVGACAVGFLLANLTVGCTAVVWPNVREADFLSANEKTNASVDLYITEEFQNHRAAKTDVMDMKNWEFELGPVATDAFKYGLAAAFTTVNLRLGVPQFPLLSKGDDNLIIAVLPTFTSFDSHDPYLFKFETYTVDIGFQVDVYDKNGAKVLSKAYKGHGEQRGAIGYQSAGQAANPVAAGLAIRNAVQQAVADIEAWAKDGKSIASTP